MDARVRALGYVVASATDLDAWYEFGSGLLGLQCVERTTNRLRFRMDEYAYRIEVRRGSTNSVLAVGWDVADEATLDLLTKQLADAGYAANRAEASVAAERGVEAITLFRDPDDLYDVELFWGLRNATPRFASPTGANFVAGELGVGHVAQSVTDQEVYRRLMFDILGFRLSDHIDVAGGKAELEFMHCNARHHSFATVQSKPGTPPVGVLHLMLEITDIDVVGRAYDKVLLNDAAPLVSTFGKHTNDKMLSFYVLSPSGFGVEYGCDGLLVDDATWLPTRYDTAHYWGHHRQLPIAS